MQIAFNAFDLDGNGTLDPTELSHVVSMLDTGSKTGNEDLKDREFVSKPSFNYTNCSWRWHAHASLHLQVLRKHLLRWTRTETGKCRGMNSRMELRKIRSLLRCCWAIYKPKQQRLRQCPAEQARDFLKVTRTCSGQRLLPGQRCLSSQWKTLTPRHQLATRAVP